MFSNSEKDANKNENKKVLTSNSKKILISNNKKDVNKNENKLKIEADSLNINDKNTVYATITGKCYNITPNCGRAKNMTPYSLSFAEASGRRKCKICYNHASKTEFSKDNK